VNDSTKRTVRTFVQFVVSAAAVLPAAVLLLPPSTGRVAAALTGAVVVATAVTKLWNTLEDKGIIPTWLKPDDSPGWDDAAYAEAWHAGHTAATAAQAGTNRGASDATMIRPLPGVEPDAGPAVILDSRRRMLTDTDPGRHSPDRGGRVPTSERGRQLGAWSASAPAPGRPVYPELDPREVVRRLDEQG